MDNYTEPVITQASPTTQDRILSPLFKVTTVSKYLALLLFILLPFFGGYVGYSIAQNSLSVAENVPLDESMTLSVQKENQVVSSREVVSFECLPNEIVDLVHTCFKVIDSNTEKVLVDNVTQIALEQKILNTNLSKPVVLVEIIYVSQDKNTVYFYSGIPDSDGCCNVHSLYLPTLTFIDVSALHLPYYASILSPNKRFMAAVDTTGSFLNVRDLERKLSINTLPLEPGLTLFGRCHEFAGMELGDIIFTSDTTITYGVFDANRENDCTQSPIEYRTVNLQ